MTKSLKVLFILPLLIQTIHTHGREKADSTRPKLKASATFSLNSNGIASIPAFSLGDPAVMAALSVAKGRFSYDPLLA